MGLKNWLAKNAPGISAYGDLMGRESDQFLGLTFN
jgi:hypothetical protein